MIKIEKVVTASPEQMMFILNALNAENGTESDSTISYIPDDDTMETAEYAFLLGEKDEELLKKSGSAARSMMPVYITVVSDNDDELEEFFAFDTDCLTLLQMKNLTVTKIWPSSIETKSPIRAQYPEFIGSITEHHKCSYDDIAWVYSNKYDFYSEVFEQFEKLLPYYYLISGDSND